ncbi:MAG: DinB family protein [Balneolaceae bacterium]|nr:DinB family protein [Balneolaceae bacterium]
MDKQQITEELKNATEELLEIIESVPEESFNASPSKNSWSPGQVVEHLIKVETGTLRSFSGPLEQCERNSEEKVEKIQDDFLNFKTKMTAFKPIIPDEKPKDKTKALNKMQDIRQRLVSLIDIQDLTELVAGFDHPLFGRLSKVEWIYFNIYHGKRHAHQIIQTMNQLD